MELWKQAEEWRNSYEAFRHFLASRPEESLHLDFKQKTHPEKLDLTNEDRKALGEALSGFANADGGMLVIGVKTAREGGVEFASEEQPISGIKAVSDKYRSLISEYLSPRMDDIDVISIDRGDDSGFVAIYVPQGSRRPYMSMAPSHQKYFRRVNDSFFPMAHYEIEDQFRQRSSPDLNLFWIFKGAGSLGKNRQIDLFFGLDNISSISARFPYIHVVPTQNSPGLAAYGLDGNGSNLWKRSSLGIEEGVVFQGGVDDVIHPNQKFFVSKFQISQTTHHGHREYWGIDKLAEGRPLRIIFKLIMLSLKK